MISSTTGSMASVRRTANVESESVDAVRGEVVKGRERESGRTVGAVKEAHVVLHGPRVPLDVDDLPLALLARDPPQLVAPPVHARARAAVVAADLGREGREGEEKERARLLGRAGAQEVGEFVQSGLDVLDPLRRRRALEACRVRALSAKRRRRGKILVSSRTLARSDKTERGLTVLSVIESNWSK